MAASRAQLAVPLLVQAPPGQVTNVYDDLVGLVASDGDAPDDDVQQFKAQADVARQEHNIEQLIVVELPDGKGRSVLSRSNTHVGEPDRFLSPRTKLSFKVDHTTLRTSDPRPYKANTHVEPLRAELEGLLDEYIKDRYETGVVEVIAVPLPRTVVDVPDEVMQEAKAVEAEMTPDTATAAVGASAGDAKEAEAEDEAKGEEQEDDMQQDDPVQAVEDAEAVEKDSEAQPEEAEPEAAATGGEEEVGQSKPEAKRTSDEDEETQGDAVIVIHLVANKYKLSNFWSGRWRSTYTIASSSADGVKEVDASSKVHIHYFEEGNVQLHTSKSQKLAVQSTATSADALAKSIVKAIQAFEESYQQELFKQSSDLSEGAFRALRRQLPMTRQKIDWDKVLNYKLGNELSK